MSENRDNKRLLEIINYSKRPYFVTALSNYSAEVFDSIEIIVDRTILTELTDEDDTNLITEMNISGVELPLGTVITWQSPMASVTASETVKVNRKFSN